MQSSHLLPQHRHSVQQSPHTTLPLGAVTQAVQMHPGAGTCSCCLQRRHPHGCAGPARGCQSYDQQNHQPWWHTGPVGPYQDSAPPSGHSRSAWL